MSFLFTFECYGRLGNFRNDIELRTKLKDIIKKGLQDNTLTIPSTCAMQILSVQLRVILRRSRLKV